MRDSTKESMENKKYKKKVYENSTRVNKKYNQSRRDTTRNSKKKKSIGCIEYSLVYFLWLTFSG